MLLVVGALAEEQVRFGGRVQNERMQTGLAQIAAAIGLVLEPRRVQRDAEPQAVLGRGVLLDFGHQQHVAQQIEVPPLHLAVAVLEERERAFAHQPARGVVGELRPRAFQYLVDALDFGARRLLLVLVALLLVHLKADGLIGREHALLRGPVGVRGLGEPQQLLEQQHVARRALNGQNQVRAEVLLAQVALVDLTRTHASVT